MGFICHACGEEWKKHPATVVPCPICQAPVGSACTRPSEHKVMYGDVHIPREQLAVDSGLLPKCPAAPPDEKPAAPQLNLFN